MEKVLVYGQTVREARKYYVPKSGQTVGARTYQDYDNGEKYDIRIVVDEKKVTTKKTKAKSDV